MKQIKRKYSMAEWFLPLILVLNLIFIPGFLQARELSEAEVLSAVQTWVRYVTADARPDAFIERMKPYQFEGRTVAYIAHLSGGGFCLCGADNLVAPVYFYSPRGTYDPQIPDYQYILREIETRLRYLRDGLQKGDPKVLQYQQVLSERASYWQELIAGRVPQRIKEPKAPFAAPDLDSLDLTCHWHQKPPYNDSCPELTPGEHAKVGCIATAMSQIMYYWQWPNTGEGNGTTIYPYRWRNDWDEEPLADNPSIPGEDCWDGRLEWTALGGGYLRMNGYWDNNLYIDARLHIDTSSAFRDALDSLWNRLTHRDTTICAANFGATNYDWSIMQDVHEDPPDEGDAEVAQLCYHAGISVRMDYGITWSGIGIPCIDTAFEDHFRYDPDACYHPDADQSVMVEEIQWLRPVEVTGSAHAWVVFGYNKNTEPWQFKMNLGHGGTHDGWWSCDSIGEGGVYILVQHFDHIAPENVVRFVGGGVPGDGSPADPYEDVEEAIVEAQDGATLIFKAGSVNEFDAATLVIDRPFTLKGHNAVIR